MGAGAFLTGGLVVFWHYNFPLLWIPFMLFVFVGLGGLLVIELQTRKALFRYWQRKCTGILWHRRFPDVPTSNIRNFLTVFVDAFGFGRSRRLCFSPIRAHWQNVYGERHDRQQNGLTAICHFRWFAPGYTRAKYDWYEKK